VPETRGDLWRRIDRKAKRMQLRQLPYMHDVQLLADQMPEVRRDKGLGRVLEQMQVASQGNFDHLAGELRRMAGLHNEHSDESTWMKNSLMPHEHAGMFDQKFRTGHWYSVWSPGNTVSDSLTDEELVCVPFWTGPYTVAVDKIAIANPFAEPGESATLDFAIYAGDGPNSQPGSLLAEGDSSLSITNSSTEFNHGVSITCEIPPGWNWLAVIETNETGIVEYSTINTTAALSGLPDVPDWTPVENLDDNDQGVGASDNYYSHPLSYVFDGSSGFPTSLGSDPDELDGPSYSYIAPMLQVRVG
jgi:hypothetical protein